VNITFIERASQEAAEQFAREHLGESAVEELRDSVGRYPDLCFVAIEDEGGIVGLCFGVQKAEDEAVLRGIAVRPDSRRMGLGTALLRRFERAAQGRGATRVSLGSADVTYVEQFYLENDYHPCGFLVTVEAADVGGLERFTVQRVRQAGGSLLINLKSGETYDPGEKQAVRESLSAKGINYIFAKRLLSSG
jgi:GNAT superfamily N-acetyltransferase